MVLHIEDIIPVSLLHAFIILDIILFIIRVSVLHFSIISDIILSIMTGLSFIVFIIVIFSFPCIIILPFLLFIIASFISLDMLLSLAIVSIIFFLESDFERIWFMSVPDWPETDRERVIKTI